jgi:hypothetical protein
MLQEAESYCQRLMDVGGPANMRAKAILRDMRSSSTTAAAAAAADASHANGPAAAAAGGGSSRTPLGARRVLGDAGAGGRGRGLQSWITSVTSQPQQQQQTPGGYGGGQVLQHTPGGCWEAAMPALGVCTGGGVQVECVVGRCVWGPGHAFGKACDMLCGAL